MPLLPARHYESEHTKFIRDLLEKRPQVDEDRRKGRAIWWDKQPRDLALRSEMDEGKVPQKGYVYSSGQ